MATVFGSVSPNTSSTTVLAAVATRTPRPSPMSATMITVASAAKAVLTRLFPSRIVGRTLAGWSTMLGHSFGAWRSIPQRGVGCAPFEARGKAASELEKKADSSRDGTRRAR